MVYSESPGWVRWEDPEAIAEDRRLFNEMMARLIDDEIANSIFAPYIIKATTQRACNCGARQICQCSPSKTPSS